jgi:uncharacterized phage-like protein YoqJ
MLFRSIEYAYSEGCRTFVTGGAIGFDTLAAREVIRFRMSHPDVKLILALPCVEQEIKWSDRQKDAYYYTLNVADEIIYISEEYTRTCMAERNRYLAENADILIAYLGRSSGGSAQTVNMAKKLGKRIYNLYPALEKETLQGEK